MDRIIIVHQWGGTPESDWYPWFKRELEQKNFQVQVPAMPDSAAPNIESWISHLFQAVGDIDEHTFFVGHSISCQAILRYLERLPADTRIGGAIFVAGWFTLQNLASVEEWKIARPWLDTPIDFEKVKRHSSKFIAIFSDDDPFVPIDNRTLFEDRLGAETFVEHGMRHFSETDGVKEVPIVLEKLLRLREK